MRHQVQRVKRDPAPPHPPLTKDVWRECVFVEADTGDEFIVVYSGKHMPCVGISRESHGRWRTVGHPVVKGT